MPGQSKNKKQDDISIVLCGAAGQGIQTVERLLTGMLKKSGCNVFATKEYMSRIRGGFNSTEIRISDRPVRSFVDRIDILVPLNKGSMKRMLKRINSETIITGVKGNGEKEVPDKVTFFEINFTELANKIGSKVYSNTIAVGALLGMLGLGIEEARDYLKEYFSGKSDEIIGKNDQAIQKGYEKGVEIAKSNELRFNLEKDHDVKEQMLINGAEAVGLGAFAGGCNFVCSYPMSPSTNVLVFMAQHKDDFDCIVEQAEDEIAAMNMTVGAWYAGARGLVTTSGGGFALMSEGLSLSAMLEMPIVIHLAQRPGPATGLPTRTEQADLELALYAGHGEFPRILLSPGTIDQSFYLTHKAFNLADKFQVPVFVLTDQYFMDTYYNTDKPDLSNLKIEKYLIQTDENYKRYELSENGISPRGIPGFGKGLVCVDSDEHDIEGHITEDFDVRMQMVDKRLKKLELIKQEVIQPELIGPEGYQNLVVCWGSVRNIVKEAVESLERDDTAILHFSQVYPVHPDAKKFLNRAKKKIMVEGNATGQFARLLKIHTDINIEHRILKYNGLNFASDEITQKLSRLL